MIGVLPIGIVSEPAFAKATAGKPSVTIYKTLACDLKLCAKDWLRIALSRDLGFPQFTSLFDLNYFRKLRYAGLEFPMTVGAYQYAFI